MNKESVTLCLCVKNEALGLRRAVESALPFVSDVVIGVDIQSSDDTLKIARELTQNVVLYCFHDDFSEIRNDVASCVKTDWIFWLDGHEYLKNPIDYAQIQEENYDGILIKHELENGMAHMQPHLIRRGIQYQGRIHERPMLQKPVVVQTCLVMHDRQGGQATAASNERAAQRERQMCEIMQHELSEDPNNLRALIHLGFFYQSKNDFKNAEKYYERYLKKSPDVTEKFMVYFQLAQCKICQQKIKYAEKILKKAVSECGEMWEFNFLKGVCAAARGNSNAAIHLFIRSLDDNTLPQRYFPIKKDVASIWDLVANERYKKCEYKFAAASWQRAAVAEQNQEQKKLYSDRSILMDDMAANNA